MIPSVPTGTLDEIIFRWLSVDKANVYFDEGYLSKIAKHFGDGKYFKIKYFNLAISMCRNFEYYCNKLYVYTAPPFQSTPPSEEESRRKSGYDKFIYNLQRKNDIIVREGRLQKIDDAFQQKGVDTLLTMDLMKLQNNKDKVKAAVLLTSDTDFVPVLNDLMDTGIGIYLYYYNDFKRSSQFSMSNHLLTACNESCLITKELLESCEYVVRRNP